MDETMKSEQACYPEPTGPYAELLQQVERFDALLKESEVRLAAVLTPPHEPDGNAPAKRDRFPSALGEVASKFGDRLDRFDQLLRRVDL